MAGVYLDTSALGRVLLGEADARGVIRRLREFDQHVASRLMRVGLRRLALGEGLLERADQLLSAVALLPLEDAVLDAAETIQPSSVATLDAIHLVTALRLADEKVIDAVMTYDTRFADGARTRAHRRRAGMRTHHGRALSTRAIDQRGWNLQRIGPASQVVPS